MSLFPFLKKKKVEPTAVVPDKEPNDFEEQKETDLFQEEIPSTEKNDFEIVLPIVDSTNENIQEEINDEELEDYDPTLDLSNYCFPSVELLKTHESVNVDAEDIEIIKIKIISILQINKLEILSIKANIGYVNTLYEIEPKAGFRISKIKQLKDDLAFTLLVSNLSIEPIMERGTIGIIVPNKEFRLLPLSPIISSSDFIESNFELPVIIGRTMKTDNFIVDLTKQPHILIAGATGKGKSVLLNIIITSLLYKKHPAELKLILIDTRIVEFNLYSSIEKHYLAKLPDFKKAVISDVPKAIKTVQSLCKEMDDRFELLMHGNTRNIQEYNAKFKKRRLSPLKGHRHLPYLVGVIDEYFDLIMTAGIEIEQPLISLTRKGHVVGIHIILATQRPTKNIITGDLKSNFPVRIAFNVASPIESRIIIDKNGAEDLSGQGDALYCEGINTTRIQVPYISTEEIEGITTFIGSQKGYSHSFDLPEYICFSDGYVNNVDLNDIDPLFEEAARLIVIHQQGSTSLIQRKFSIGYNRAGRLMDQLESAGIVGITQGSAAREVLITNEYRLEEKLKSYINK